MRRWPSWVLVTLVPVSIVAALVCVVAELPVLFVPELALVVLAVGAILLLSDRRHGRDASTSIAYRGPGSGWADSWVDQTALRYAVWRWIFGDAPQDPRDPSHQFTPGQRRGDQVVTGTALILMAAIELGTAVFIVVLLSVKQWWGTASMWAPLFPLAVCVVALYFQVELVLLAVRDQRVREKQRADAAQRRARRVALAHVTITRNVPRELDAVWRDFTEPDALRAWFWPPAWNTVVTIDLRKGGAFRIAASDHDLAVGGTYSIVEQWSRLQCSWRWDGENVRTSVRIAFERLDGATRVTIDHLGFPAQDEADRSAEGWNSCLDRLVALAAKG